MARRQVIELACDRCGRVETQPLKGDGKDERPRYELEVSFHGQEVKYEDLCRRCRSACENYFKNMTKQPEPEEEPNVEAAKEEESPTKRFLGMGKKAG